jgi:hypothetical protein
VLHGWLRQELSDILAALPDPVMTLTPEAIKTIWAIWTAGLTSYPTLPAKPAAARVRLIPHNLAGHLTPAFVIWLFDHGIIIDGYEQTKSPTKVEAEACYRPK